MVPTGPPSAASSEATGHAGSHAGRDWRRWVKSAARLLGVGAGPLVVLAAAAVLAWSAVSTASGQVAGRTGNAASLLEAAVIDLSVGAGADASRSLGLDTDGLHPGLPVERCVTIQHTGSLGTVPVRLWAHPPAGTGLDHYLATRIEVGRGRSPDCSDFVPQATAFAGRLDGLAASHADYASGLPLGRAGPAPITVRFRFEVVSDNRAQGLATDLELVFEARP
jgi:hypothetical protein